MKITPLEIKKNIVRLFDNRLDLLPRGERLFEIKGQDLEIDTHLKEEEFVSLFAFLNREQTGLQVEKCPTAAPVESWRDMPLEVKVTHDSEYEDFKRRLCEGRVFNRVGLKIEEIEANRDKRLLPTAVGDLKIKWIKKTDDIDLSACKKYLKLFKNIYAFAPQANNAQKIIIALLEEQRDVGVDPGRVIPSAKSDRRKYYDQLIASLMSATGWPAEDLKQVFVFVETSKFIKIKTPTSVGA